MKTARSPRPALVALSASCLLATAANAQVNLAFSDPAGGWNYILNGDAAAGDVAAALDGSFSHGNGSDEWDGTAIGSGRPGGVSALISGATDYLRLQDTGDPRDHGFGDPGSNRKLYFTHDLGPNLSAGYAPLTSGITLSFRARVATGDPLDMTAPDGGGGRADWPAGGDGYVVHDGGKGNFTIREGGVGTISFSLGDPGAGGLLMNNLNGTSASGDVDTGEGGTANAFDPGDITMWHEYWITLVADTSGGGTHRADIYVDGSLIADSFHLTAGTGSDAGGNYLGLGVGATPHFGAIDVDFFTVGEGVIAPVPEPAMVALAAGLAGLALVGWRRRRR